MQSFGRSCVFVWLPERVASGCAAARATRPHAHCSTKLSLPLSICAAWEDMPNLAMMYIYICIHIHTTTHTNTTLPSIHQSPQVESPHNVQPIAFGVSFLHSQISIDKLVLCRPITDLAMYRVATTRRMPSVAGHFPQKSHYV